MRKISNSSQIPNKRAIVPPETPISLATKLDVGFEIPKTRLIEELFVVDPSVTPEVVLLMVTVGTVPSYVQLN